MKPIKWTSLGKLPIALRSGTFQMKVRDKVEKSTSKGRVLQV